jgi:hypothetical protein
LLLQASQPCPAPSPNTHSSPRLFGDGNGVERLGDKRMEWRAVTAPHEKTSRSIMDVRCLASAFHLPEK